MDESDAAALFDQIAPELGAREHAVRDAEPALADLEVLDRALRQALARLRQDVSHETFVYLRWRAEQALRTAQATRDASAAARAARGASRAAGDVGRSLGSARTFRTANGALWSVHEAVVGAMPWARGDRCLLFQSESAIRRVWHYAAEWRGLSDTDLEALSWQV